MKTVTLKQLSVKNFRGFKNITVDFKSDSTIISGANETGKSSILEAFMWLLFGKDSQDRKDHEIKHLVNGVSIPKTDVEVGGILDIDGQEVTLKRQFVEDWVKPRGQADEIFKGNKTATYYNDVPMNVGEYQERINDIINDTVFKMVTNPVYFTSMKWSEQREQLFQIAGAISDADIAKTDPKYAALLDRISGKSFADFKREIAAKKRKAKEALENIQPRIDQTVKLMPEDRDFSGMEKDIALLEKQQAEIENAINDKTEAVRQQYEAAQAKQREANALKSKCQQLIREAENNAKETAYAANTALRSLQQIVGEAESELKLYISQLERAQKEMEYSESRHEELSRYVSNLRNEWIDVNSQEYGGTDTCPACDQLLPAHKRETARQNFTNWKTEKLAKITDRGNNLKNEIEALDQDIKKAKECYVKMYHEAESKEKELNGLKDQLSRLKPSEPEPIIANEIPEYVELSRQIEKLELEIREIEAGKGEDTADLRENKRAVTDLINSIKTELKDRGTITEYRKEIASLEDQGRELAQQIADLEQTEFTIKSFVKTKIGESEKRINQLFKYVTFKLFNYTIDGDENETCEALVKGVPYSVANTAGKINAGLDIIRALQNHYQVLMPIFCDNSEAVNDFPAMDNQMIYLLVTREDKLTIK